MKKHKQSKSLALHLVDEATHAGASGQHHQQVGEEHQVALLSVLQPQSQQRVRFNVKRNGQLGTFHIQLESTL